MSGWLPDPQTMRFRDKVEKAYHDSGFEPSVYVNPRSGQMEFKLTKHDVVKRLKLPEKYGFIPHGERVEFVGFLLESREQLEMLIVSGFFSEHAPVFIFTPKEKVVKK